MTILSQTAQTQKLDYSKPVLDCCKLEKSPTMGENAKDDNMSNLLLMIVVSPVHLMMYLMKKIHPMKKWMKKERKFTKKST